MGITPLEPPPLRPPTLLAARASRPHAPAYNKKPADKDEREISRDLEDMIHSLDGAAAMGQAEGDEGQELLRASLRQAMLLSKRIARVTGNNRTVEEN